jgi:protein-S-isoprenylcysteine O-methyltransferase Ste14
MTTNSAVEQGNQDLNKGIRKRIRQLVVQTAGIGAILFVSAGTLRWLGAWVYLFIYVLGIAISGLLLYRLNREVIAERAEVRPETKGWDRIVTSLVALLIVAVFVVGGLDFRFGWSPALALWLWLAAVTILILSSAFSSWAMISNAFFAPTVSIQKDRGHRVVKGGPYQFVRHPAYSGWIIGMFATALVLGSLWALVPAGLATIIFVVRTALEDRTLQMELSGYQDYTAEVKYRLVPGVW